MQVRLAYQTAVGHAPLQLSPCQAWPEAAWLVSLNGKHWLYRSDCAMLWREAVAAPVAVLTARNVEGRD